MTVVIIQNEGGFPGPIDVPHSQRNNRQASSPNTAA
jgi:hypothetical protein